jgi:hypothetical protein
VHCKGQGQCTIISFFVSFLNYHAYICYFSNFFYNLENFYFLVDNSLLFLTVLKYLLK